MAGVARNNNARPSDMLISLAVLLVPVVLISWFFTRTPEPKAQPVDWRPVLADARSRSPYPVLAPENLPDTWVVTKARWAAVGQTSVNQQPAPGNTWELGVMTPDQMYVSLTQRDAAGEPLVSDLSGGGYLDGTSTVGGVTWKRVLSPSGRTRVIYRTEGAVTTVVAGDVAYEGLDAFASTLKP